MEARETEGLEETPAPPSVEEDADLVALLDEARETKRFGLPAGGGKVSDDFWIEARRWTAAQERRYAGAGADWRADKKGKATQAVMRADPAEQLRVLCEESVTGFRLRLDGRVVSYSGTQSVWQVVSQLHPKVADWIQKTLREFQGLEVTGDSGEAS